LKFEWVCRECEIYWDREYRIAQAPSRTKCPKCRKLSNRYWQNSIPAVHFNSKGFPDRDRKLAKTGGHVAGDSDEVCKELIKDSAKSIQHGNAMYQRVEFNPEGWNEAASKLSGEERDKAGYFKPISDERKQEKQRTVKKMTGDAYDKHLPEKTVGPNDPRIKQQ
tara:strand:- start:3559 stop:4053 length:495 start_codon:yes stop_codon:yes gene_type:complete